MLRKNLVGRIAVRTGPAGGPAIRGPRHDGKQQPAVLGKSVSKRPHPERVKACELGVLGGLSQFQLHCLRKVRTGALSVQQR